MIELITFILILSTAIAFAVPAYYEHDIALLSDTGRKAWLVGAAPCILAVATIEIGYDCIVEKATWPLTEGWVELTSELKDIWYGR